MEVKGIQYGLGHTLDVVFARNLYNNVIVEKAIYRMANGDVMYVYHDDKTLGRTIELRHLDIPKEYWVEAQKIPLNTIYYKEQTATKIIYNWVDIWELAGKQVIACGYDGDNNFFFETSDICEYIIQYYSELKITGEIKGKVIEAVEVARTSYSDYELRIKVVDGCLVICGEEDIDNVIRVIDVISYPELKLYDENLQKFIE